MNPRSESVLQEGAAVPGKIDFKSRIVEVGVISGVGMTTGTERAGLATLERSARDGLSQRLHDYVTLTKPRIISLLLVTTIAPMTVAVGGWPGMPLVLATLLGGYLMAGGANALNMYLERDVDARMRRTSLRPVPSGRMAPGHALVFGIALGAASFLLFTLLVNLLSAVLALCGLLYYVLVYTAWLKRSTPQNIVIGGAAGAFPPLVGWAAATGEVTATAIVLFAIVFFWTPPHFWALALVKQKDYARVGIPMAPAVWGEERTLRKMLLYTLALLPLSLLPLAWGDLGLTYGALALALGIWFVREQLRIHDAAERYAAAWSFYRTSLLYLALLFGAMVADVVVRGALSA
jgi:heme o synthase